MKSCHKKKNAVFFFFLFENFSQKNAFQSVFLGEVRKRQATLSLAVCVHESTREYTRVHESTREYTHTKKVLAHLIKKKLFLHDGQLHVSLNSCLTAIIIYFSLHRSLASIAQAQEPHTIIRTLSLPVGQGTTTEGKISFFFVQTKSKKRNESKEKQNTPLFF